MPSIKICIQQIYSQPARCRPAPVDFGSISVVVSVQRADEGGDIVAQHVEMGTHQAVGGLTVHVENRLHDMSVLDVGPGHRTRMEGDLPAVGVEPATQRGRLVAEQRVVTGRIDRK